MAIRQIEQLHYMPVRIELVGSAPAPASKDQKNGAPATVTKPIISATLPAPTQKLKIPHTQLLIFTEQLGHLLKAGMTLDEGLSVLEKATQATARATNDPRPAPGTRGRPEFFASPSRFPRVFPPIYVNLVAAGEASGALPDILARLVEHLMQAKICATASSRR